MHRGEREQDYKVLRKCNDMEAEKKFCCGFNFNFENRLSLKSVVIILQFFLLTKSIIVVNDSKIKVMFNVLQYILWDTVKKFFTNNIRIELQNKIFLNSK